MRWTTDMDSETAKQILAHLLALEAILTEKGIATEEEVQTRIAEARAEMDRREAEASQAAKALACRGDPKREKLWEHWKRGRDGPPS